MATSNKQIKTNSFTKKFIIDRNETFVDDQTVSYHRNGLFQSTKSTELFAVSEPSNFKCIQLPADYLGHIKLIGEQQYLIFSGNSSLDPDQHISEIGIADTLNCIYSKIVRNSCLNFSKDNGPIDGSIRINQDKEQEIIFCDGKNPDRFINLDKIPYTYTIDETTKCKVKVYTGILDCDQIRLDPFIKFPKVEVFRGASGALPSGVYSVHLAYVLDDIKFSDYMSTTLPIQINNEIAGTNSIALQISNLDRNFDEYQLVLTGTIKGVTSSKIIGQYPTSLQYVTITDWINEEYQDGITAAELLVHKRIYNSTHILESNSEYLLRADVTRKPEINYQPQAFNIKAQYYVKQVPLKYYRDKGEDVGYFRNENYNFVIRWYWGDGEPTKHAQIANREKRAKDKMQAVGNDVFEHDLTVRTIQSQKNLEYWQAYNTASSMYHITQDREDWYKEEKFIGFGSFGYFESVEHYPDDLEIFGENACTPIRYFKFPDESKVPRYTVDKETEEIFINILGVKFSNIEYPKDKNGNYIEGLTHFEILRSERDESNSTVVARGIVTNMGEYKDEKGVITAYSNFPHNSVKPNSYLSKKQTWAKHGKEYDFSPLNKFYNNKFTFYSPYGNYFGRRSLANSYINFESEEYGETSAYFEEPYKHPKHKLLSNYAFYLSACIGVIEALTLVIGSKSVTVNQSQMPWDIVGLSIGSFNAGGSTTIGSLYPTQSTTTSDNPLSFPRFYADLKGTPAALVPVKMLINTIKLLISLGGFVIQSAKFVSEILETIKNFSETYQYARQMNSSVFYNQQKRIRNGFKRRAFEEQPFYLTNGIHTSRGTRINNGGRNGGIYLHIKNGVPFPSVEDTSRFTMQEAQLVAHSKKKVKRVSSAYYVTIMKNNPNQYGSIDGVKPVKIHTNPIEVVLDKTKETNIYETDVLFGGDCIIAEQTHLNRCPLFRQDLTNTDFPDNVAFDYRLYNNVGYPRFWIDSTDYEIGEMMEAIGKAQPVLEKLPNHKFNLDIVQTIKGSQKKLIQKNQVFYTSVNGAFKYIVEVPYNISFRDNKQEGEGTALYALHYSDSESNLSTIFRADMRNKPENYSLDYSYTQLSQRFAVSEQLIKIPKAPIRERNTVLYSLPSTQNQVYNNWRYFLPLNRFSFDERDYGYLTGVHALDQDRILFLFSQASPYILPGRDQLQTMNGRNVIIGDGGLFAVSPREMMKTHIAYGSNHDPYAFNSNQFGNFYVSEQQGKLFNLKNNLEEFSRNGWHKWCANFIPLQLKKQFPGYSGIHNPLGGVGYQLVFDNFYETLYICKKDYYCINPEVIYHEDTNTFTHGFRTIELGDPEFFEDCSLTLSYWSPMETFVSFHDWHPDGVIQEERHFLTAKGDSIWKHNDRLDSFCNFYGKDYPYQLGFTISTGQTTTILNNIEYIQEAYIYKTNELDRYSPFNETFDWAIVYNQEQLSGMLKLIPSTDVREDFRYFPNIINDYQMEIPIKKAEGKWRFNMFYDYTKNRGRVENYDKQPFVTQKNGYTFIVNQPYLDFYSNPRPPRFRNHWHSVWLSREKLDNIQFITKFSNTQLNISPR